jgi:hypothetical protein
MSELKVNKVTPRSGTTVTLGDSGDTITIPSGATLSGTSIALSGNIGLGGATPTTSGTGITFPATASASTNANTLDDYEEGTWSPTFSGTTGAPSGSNFTSRVGTYVKIGKSVTVSIFIHMSNWSSGPTGNLIITTLPFTSTSLSSYRSAASIGFASNFAEAPKGGVIQNGETRIFLYKSNSTSALNNFSTNSPATDTSGDELIVVTATYETD